MTRKRDPSKPRKGRSDWSGIQALTEDQKEARARSDPDFTDIDRLERVPNVALLRKRLGELSQTQFAERYGIPVATVRDWEQGRSRPEKGMRSYLRVIAKIPDKVQEALRV